MWTRCWEVLAHPHLPKIPPLLTFPSSLRKSSFHFLSQVCSASPSPHPQGAGGSKYCTTLLATYVSTSLLTWTALTLCFRQVREALCNTCHHEGPRSHPNKQFGWCYGDTHLLKPTGERFSLFSSLQSLPSLLVDIGSQWYPLNSRH